MKQVLIINLLLTLTLFFFTACTKEKNNSSDLQFTSKKLGLENRTINEMYISSDSLFVAANDGMFVKNIDSNTPFASIGLTGKNIIAFCIFKPGHIIASAGNRFSYSEEAKLYETTNNGSTWQPVNNNFGGESVPQKIISLSSHPADQNMLYGTGFGSIAKSADKGRTWQLLYGDWDAAATGLTLARINPLKTDEMWFGGQGGIENGYLGILKDSAVQREWHNLVPNPTVPVELMFTNNSQKEIFVGFEGALLKTTDNGNSWKTLIDEHSSSRFFFGIDRSTIKQDLIFAGGWLKGMDTQPFKIWYSFNGGSSWKSIFMQDETHGGITRIKVKSEAGKERIFAGLYKGGVYEIIMK